MTVNIILDSGAFSAWTKEEEIDIEDYAAFAINNLQVFDYIINLDVIPGKIGKKGTDLSQEEVEGASRKGYRNYRTMLKSGIPKDKLIHVFHQEENFIWLKRMVKNMSYIGLSPANDRSSKEKKIWLDECMNHVLDDKGYPLVKFHGFGVTSISIMFRYPWYSVDSGSWMQYSKYGAVLVPKSTNGKYNYKKNPFVIFLSSKSPKLKQEGKHFTTLSDIEQEYILKYFAEKNLPLGESEFIEEEENIIERGLCNDHKLRDQLNLFYFLDVEKTMPIWPWAYTPQRGML